MRCVVEWGVDVGEACIELVDVLWGSASLQSLLDSQSKKNAADFLFLFALGMLRTFYSQYLTLKGRNTRMLLIM